RLGGAAPRPQYRRLLCARRSRARAHHLLPRAVRPRVGGAEDSPRRVARAAGAAAGARRVMQPPGPGADIDGFRLGQCMHVGSMASIYRLEGRGGALPLVMKVPRLGAGEKSANVVSFEQCRMVLGALAQSVHHPTLVAYGDVETTPYLVMEYVEGARLDEWLRRAPLDAAEVARLGHLLALALHEIHRQDVIHLDLKASNVLLRPNGAATLIDFGLSCHRHLPDLLAAEF